MIFKKFGKSSDGLLQIKKSFFEQNKVHLNEQLRINKIYLQQPDRTHCKNCNSPITGYDFISHDVPYKICEECTHLNGMKDETPSFFDLVYHTDAGRSYSQVYSESNKHDYDFRVAHIYRPKAEFLSHCLKSEGISITKSRVCDFGAGSGYFVKALALEGLEAIGLEVSQHQVAFGNAMLGQHKLSTFDPKETLNVLSEVSCNVLSLIGVLEHLPDPRAALKAIATNSSIQYVYLSLPLFSPSVYFELLFQDSFNRQLGGAHTHLYTLKSIEYFCNEFNYDIRAQWFFGTDIMDLYRHTICALKKLVSTRAKQLFQSMLTQQIDKLQVCLDQAELSSECHVLIRKIGT